MNPENPITLSSESIQMIVGAVTENGQSKLSAIEAERLLNAIARAQSGVPTGVSAKGTESH